jgi:GTP-binding protein
VTIPEAEREERVKAFVDGYFGKRRPARNGATGSDQPHVFVISALTGEGCRELSYAVMAFLEQSANALAAAEPAAAPE